MASILIGLGEQQLRIEGDVMRIDQTAQTLEQPTDASTISSSQVTRLSSLDSPNDDCFISELPQAVRQTKAEDRERAVLKSTVVSVKDFVFVFWEPSVEAWLPLAGKKNPPEDALIAYYLGDNQVVFNGVFYYPSEEVGKEIYCQGFYLGRVIAPQKAFIRTL